jgi:hypothetical protein
MIGDRCASLCFRGDFVSGPQYLFLGRGNTSKRYKLFLLWNKIGKRINHEIAVFFSFHNAGTGKVWRTCCRDLPNGTGETLWNVLEQKADIRTVSYSSIPCTSTAGTGRPNIDAGPGRSGAIEIPLHPQRPFQTPARDDSSSPMVRRRPRRRVSAYKPETFSWRAAISTAGTHHASRATLYAAFCFSGTDSRMPCRPGVPHC